MKKTSIGIALAFLLFCGVPSFSQEVHYLLEGTGRSTPVHVLTAPAPGPAVMVVGGVHGDERAGILAAERALELPIRKGTLVVVPRANRQAVEAGLRAIPGQGNLNRMFPDGIGGGDLGGLAEALFSLLKKHRVELLIDLHESEEFQSLSVKGLGQTVIFFPNDRSLLTAHNVVETINAGIEESTHKFSLESPPVEGSLVRAAGRELGIGALILETGRQLPLERRVELQVEMLSIILAGEGMLVRP
jgi:predicted deacylase